MDWIASALIWAGNVVLIKRKSWVAFCLYLAANILWLAWWIPRKEWAAAFLVATLAAQNIWGIIDWRKQK